MQSISKTPPAFGQATFDNCEREQIHLAGSIQPHGALLVLDDRPALTVVQASANAAAMFGLDRSPLGQPLVDIAPDLERRVRLQLDARLDGIPVPLRCVAGPRLDAFDALLHRPAGGGLILEVEPAEPHRELVRHIDPALQQLTAAPSLQALCDETARLFKEIVGYDRVMVYRFDEDGHGEILSEQREPHLESFLGNRYPASDIPQIARRLYEINRVRLLVDVGYEPVPIEPRRSPVSGAELDMSLCMLRSMSPIHLEYLRNMGVAATLVISLVAGDRLWGLIACHHGSRRFVPYPVRALCEVLGEAVATRIAALEGLVQVQAELLVRRLEHRMIGAISRDGDWKAALFDSPSALLKPVRAAGAVLLTDGELLTAGEVPATGDLRALAAWLDARPREPVLACSSLAERAPRLAHLKDVASGVLAVPLSGQPGDYLIWLRPEQIRTVTWGGNPFKPVEVGSNPERLTPRRSFEKWHQLVEGTAEPWSASDRVIARLVGESVADVIQQFRAVRVLIAQHQLERMQQQVCGSDQPTAIFGRDGDVLMLNDALARLLPPGPRPPTLAAFAELLHPVPEAVLRLEELRATRRAWRGEAEMVGAGGERVPMLVRADPVLAAPNDVLGFVLLLTDVRQRQRAEAARRRFQHSVPEPPPAMAAPLQSGEDLLYRRLLGGVVRNARLAALEIADGVDLDRVPEMLDGVQASVARTSELLEHLLRYERDGSPRRH